MTTNQLTRIPLSREMARLLAVGDTVYQGKGRVALTVSHVLRDGAEFGLRRAGAKSGVVYPFRLLTIEVPTDVVDMLP